MDFGARIKQLREAAGLSQNELARRAGISQSGLSYLETGGKSPNIDTLIRICDAIGISVIEFLADELPAPEIPPHIRELLETAKDLDPEQVKHLTEFIKGLKTCGS